MEARFLERITAQTVMTGNPDTLLAAFVAKHGVKTPRQRRPEFYKPPKSARKFWHVAKRAFPQQSINRPIGAAAWQNWI